MLCRVIIHLLTGLLPVVAIAQDKIEIDRPTEAQNASLVSKGSFQAELGFRRNQENKTDYHVQHPNAVFRYGLIDQLEFRLETAMETQHIQSENSSSYGLKPLELGIKANVFHTKDTSFSISLYGLVGLPQIASKDLQHNETFYRVRLLFQNRLSDKISLIYNLGRDWDSDERQQNWIYAVSPQIELSDKWQAFVEDFAFIQKGSKPEHYIDAGFAYLISNHLLVDLDVGKGLSKKSAHYFFTTGISFKL